jgi:hypothetical protein
MSRKGLIRASVVGVIALVLVAASIWMKPFLPVSGEVPLLTGVPPMLKADNGDIGCFTNSAAGLLVADPKYGTAIIIDTDIRSDHTPVAWRPGFSARRVGSEVEVLAPDGQVVATTGKRYLMDGGSEPGWFGVAGSLFYACDRVTPL